PRHCAKRSRETPLAHAQLGQVLLRRDEHDAAIAEFERAIALNPNFTDWRFAEVLVYARTLGTSRRGHRPAYAIGPVLCAIGASMAGSGPLHAQAVFIGATAIAGFRFSRAELPWRPRLARRHLCPTGKH